MQTIEKSIEIEAPVERVYRQWTRFEEFPRFMEGVEEVRQLDDRHLHWIAKAGGKRKEWDAEIVDQIPERRIAWRSTSGAPNAGIVHFISRDRDHTMVTVQMNYEPEGAMEKIGSALGVLDGRVEADLQHFKDFIQGRSTETGSSSRDISGGPTGLTGTGM